MPYSDDSNILFSLAIELVNHSSRHIFLTGKAGTGKTTFLRYIKENSFKKMAIVAPTGVAAINAGGVTMHSLFQLPMGSFIPTSKHLPDDFNGPIHNRHTLLKNLRLSEDKRELLRELDLIIIDEISMVRADMLDATDIILRHVRRQHLLPFGGVQMLYIGDLFQLPPVIKNAEWEILKDHYRSPFFFDAQVMQQSVPVHIELKHIYRQSDDKFINILNNVRNNCCTRDDLLHLHQLYKPGFSPAKEENFITLTTHNDKADIINRQELKKLAGELFVFEAIITGEFSERSYPAEEILHLKEGAQIMFLRNDRGEARRYFNGKIGIIKKIEKNEIWVAFPGQEELLKLERETWENIRYHYDKEKDRISEEEMGTFSQFPIRLAWAITIHKSQGLTFEKAIIDAGQAFAPGQVYVALSRLTGLQGLILRSPIHASAIRTDERIIEFTRNELPHDILQAILQKEKLVYIKQTLMQAFSWEKTKDILEQHSNDFEHRQLPHKQDCIEQSSLLSVNLNEMQDVSIKFQKQIETYFEQAEKNGFQSLFSRTHAASDYFIKATDEKLLKILQLHIDDTKQKQKVKKYVNELLNLKLHFERRRKQLQQIKAMAESLQYANDENGLEKLMNALQQPVVVVAATKETGNNKRQEKGETQRISLRLFKQGKTIAEIAKERNLAYTTIEGHLAGFISSGEIDVLDIVTEIKLQKILEILDSAATLTSSEIRRQLGDNFSYGEIKAAMKYREKERI